jgi:hypothetical protein
MWIKDFEGDLFNTHWLIHIHVVIEETDRGLEYWIYARTITKDNYQLRGPFATRDAAKEQMELILLDMATI